MNANRNTPKKTVRRTLAFLGKPLTEATEPSRTAAKPARVSGPYYDSNINAYRLVVFDGNKRKSVRSETAEGALALKAELERSLQQSDRTVGQALNEFLNDRRERGLKALSIETLRYKLEYFLPLHQNLAEVSAEQAQLRYDNERQRITRYGNVTRAQTHHRVLRIAKLFFRWTTEQGYLRVNPFQNVKPVGKPHVGKLQLRIDEARRLTDVLVHAAQQSNHGAIAVFCQLMLGLRVPCRAKPAAKSYARSTGRPRRNNLPH